MSSLACAVPRAALRAPRAAHPVVPSYDVYRVTPGDRHLLRIVSPEITSIYTHWANGRTLPCTSNSEAECEHHRFARKIQNWVFVVKPSGSKLMLLQIPNRALREFLSGLDEPGRDLRGVLVELWREDSKNIESPMLGQEVEEENPVKSSITLPDIDWALHRMWTAPKRMKRWIPTRGYRPAGQEQAAAPPPPRKNTPEEIREIRLKAVAAGLMTPAQMAEKEAAEVAAKGGQHASQP